MPKYRTLRLNDAQRAELVETLTRSKKAYLRERAAAILKIADGTPAAQVAQGGLLQVRDPDTLYSWLNRYLAEGLPGLHIRPGRGRKPAFSPSVPYGG